MRSKMFWVKDEKIVTQYIYYPIKLLIIYAMSVYDLQNINGWERERERKNDWNIYLVISKIKRKFSYEMKEIVYPIIIPLNHILYLDITI